jgi:chemotaxis protein MotB
VSKRKKKGHGEGHVDESWLIPYADLLTLLLALFIVLYASSNVDSVKFKQMSDTFQAIFNSSSSILEYPNPQLEPASGEKLKDNDDGNNTAKIHKDTLETLKARVDDYLVEKDLKDEVATIITKEGLMLTIRDDILFESGKAEMGKAENKIARDISKLLVINPPVHITITGHTDNVPIKNSQFDSNWHLSVMRAVNFMKVILDNKDLDPRNFSGKGFGEFKPVATNKTPEGRKKNRRVEVLIQPTQTVTK